MFTAPLLPLLATGALISPAPAATTPTIALSPCGVSHSRNAGGFAYASCTITAQGLTGPTSVTYKSSLTPFDPGTLGPWRKRTGTIALGDGGILTIKFAFKHKTVAQVRQALKVTLSNPTGGATVVSGAAS